MTSRKTLVTVLVTAALITLAGFGAYGLYMLGMQRGMQASQATPAPSPVAADSAAPAAGAADPQSIAEGEEATRRHISAGIKAGDTDPATGRRVLY